jgi:hypothetical protein
LRVRGIMDERHPFIYEDELATKARAMIRDFALMFSKYQIKKQKDEES